MKKLTLTLSFLIFCGCSHQTTAQKTLPTYEHYRACDLMSLDFVSTMQCGKTTRSSYCLPDKCSQKGNKLVAYYDQLVQSVQMGDLTETEARKLFLKRNNEAEREYIEVMKELNSK